MKEFRRERKPARRFGGSGFGSDRPKGRFSDESSPRRFGGRPERRFSRDSDRPGRLEMFDVVCDKCGKECQVPFKPTSQKPVYCSDCFRKNEDSFSRGGSDSRDRASSSSSEDLIKINKKLDKILKALKIE